MLLEDDTIVYGELFILEHLEMAILYQNFVPIRLLLPLILIQVAQHVLFVLVVQIFKALDWIVNDLEHR